MTFTKVYGFFPVARFGPLIFGVKLWCFETRLLETMVGGEESEIHVSTLEVGGQSEPRNVCSDWSLTKAPSQSHEVSHQAMVKRPWHSVRAQGGS